MSKLDYFIRPPEVADRPYEEAITGPAWYDAGGSWDRLIFYSDEEASALSGVPERSLRTLQSAEIINATQAPLASGGHRRVWHLSEVAGAAVLEQFKRATNSNYIEAAKVTYVASVKTKIVFAMYCTLQHVHRHLFVSELVFADARVLALRANSATQKLINALTDKDESLPELNVFDDHGVSILGARPRDGEWGYLHPNDSALRGRLNKIFQSAQFFVALNISNVFRAMEIKAKTLRRA